MLALPRSRPEGGSRFSNGKLILCELSDWLAPASTTFGIAELDVFAIINFALFADSFQGQLHKHYGRDLGLSLLPTRLTWLSGHEALRF
jgi:hypothetical protein